MAPRPEMAPHLVAEEARSSVLTLAWRRPAAARPPRHEGGQRWRLHLGAEEAASSALSRPLAIPTCGGKELWFRCYSYCK